MSPPESRVPVAELPVEVRPPSVIAVVWRSMVGRMGVIVGLFALGLIAFGRFFTPYDPRAIRVGLPGQTPSSEFWLGTDALGRDVLSRLMAGGDVLLLVPLIAVTISLLIGGGLGLIAAYVGRTTDTIISGLFDFLLTIPPLLIVLVIVAGFGTSTFVISVTLAIVFAPGFGRVVRSVARDVTALPYVDAARARGEGPVGVIFRDVLPNTTGPVLAEFSLRTTYAILFVASLSYLGLGVQPPAPDWGLMVAENRSLLAVTPLASLAPAAAICMLSIAFNLIADALTNFLDRGESARMVQL